jgi:hypothetical protein
MEPESSMDKDIMEDVPICLGKHQCFFIKIHCDFAEVLKGGFQVFDDFLSENVEIGIIFEQSKASTT